MTSDFDNLMGIWSISQKDAIFKPIAEWLRDICVEEANQKKKGWTFETWKEKQGTVYLENEQKWEFLNDCHDILDHTQFHLKVFHPDTQSLIHAVYQLFRGRDLDKQDAKKWFKRHLPKLMELMQQFGVEENKYSIKLKGVERQEW